MTAKTYQLLLHYGDKGAGYIFSDDDIRKVEAETKKMMAFYRDELGYRLNEVKIEATCKACWNTGEVKTYKGIIAKVKPCSCKLAYAKEQYQVSTLVNRDS